MSKHDGGGGAFPNDGGPGSNGMTLLDYFAGQVMATLLIDAKPAVGRMTQDEMKQKLAEASYDIASAMIAEKRRREREA